MRQHVERFHVRELVRYGKEGTARKISWRSKAGVRRISHDSLSEAVNNHMRKSFATKTEVLCLLTTVLRLCLVKVGNDTE